MPEDDEHHLVVDGRRWRRSDPAIPATLRQELVDELMAARRAVKTDPSSARPRVQDAKVALGERGAPWWQESSSEEFTNRARATVAALLRHRDGRTICPSDVARVVGGKQWRSRMDAVRAVVWAMADEGLVQVLQKGEPVGRDARGPVRIAARRDRGESS